MTSTAIESVICDWQRWLSAERRMATNTVKSYGQDAGSFSTFMMGHLGHPTDLSDLTSLSIRDFRAWLTWLSERGLSPRSRARAIFYPQFVPLSGQRWAGEEPSTRRAPNTKKR